MPGNQGIDHVAVGGMHRNQSAVVAHHPHQVHHLPIVNHQGTFVGHKGLEGADALFFNHGHHFFAHFGVEIGYRHVVGIIAHSLSFRFFLPGAKRVVQGVALGLQYKVNHHGGSAKQGGPGAGGVIVAGIGSHKGHVQMHVGVNSARNNQLARSINQPIYALGWQGMAYARNFVVLYQQVGGKGSFCRNQGSILN